MAMRYILDRGEIWSRSWSNTDHRIQVVCIQAVRGELCENCQILLRRLPSIKRNKWKRTTPYVSLANLDQSASNSCDFCRHVWQHIVCNSSIGGDTFGKIKILFIPSPHGKINCFISVGKEKVQEPLSLWMFPERPPSTLNDDIPLRDVDSKVAQVQAWLSACCDKDKHNYCSESPSDDSAAPTRLVYIKAQSSYDYQLRLYTTPKDFRDTYTTLSYCWGDMRNNVRTTVANASAFFNHIPWRGLPRTVKDAIILTQKLENSEDWKTESQNIGRYYENSALTIAAATATDCKQGFLFNTPKLKHIPNELVIQAVVTRAKHKLVRPLQRFTTHREDNRPPVFIGVCPDTTQDDKQSTLFPLLSRGWVTQELAFSRRTVYFSSDFLLWNCISGSVTNPKKVNQNFVSHGLPPRIRTRSFWGWKDFVEKYSTTKLTFESDKLIAISSIVQRIEKTTSAKYLHGLWSEDMMEELAWSVTHLHSKERNQESISPSWSWASVNATVTYGDSLILTVGGSTRIHGAIHVTKTHQPKLGNSSIDNAFLHISGHCGIFEICKFNQNPDLPRKSDTHHQREFGLYLGTSGLYCSMTLDSVPKEDGVPKYFFCFLLFSFSVSTMDHRITKALMLEDTGVAPFEGVAQYKRIGLMYFHHSREMMLSGDIDASDNALIDTLNLSTQMIEIV